MKRKVFSDMLSCSSTSWVRAERNRRRRGLKGLPLTAATITRFKFLLMIGTVIKTLSSSTHKGIKCVVMQIWISLKTTFDNGVDDDAVLWSNKSWVSLKLKILFHYESVVGSLERLDVCHYSNYFLYCAFALSSLLSTFYKINSWRLCIFVMYLKVRQ